MRVGGVNVRAERRGQAIEPGNRVATKNRARSPAASGIDLRVSAWVAGAAMRGFYRAGGSRLD
jgi:hypothetical protein